MSPKRGAGAGLGVGILRGSGDSPVPENKKVVSASWFRSFMASWFPHFLVLKLRGFKVVWFSSSKFSKVQGF